MKSLGTFLKGFALLVLIFSGALLLYTLLGGPEKYFDTTKVFDAPLLIGLAALAAVYLGWKMLWGK